MVDYSDLVVLQQPFGHLVVRDNVYVVNPGHVHGNTPETEFQFIDLDIAAIRIIFNLSPALQHPFVFLASKSRVVAVASQINKVDIEAGHDVLTVKLWIEMGNIRLFF